MLARINRFVRLHPSPIVLACYVIFMLSAYDDVKQRDKRGAIFSGIVALISMIALMVYAISSSWWLGVAIGAAGIVLEWWFLNRWYSQGQRDL